MYSLLVNISITSPLSLSTHLPNTYSHNTIIKPPPLPPPPHLTLVRVFSFSPGKHSSSVAPSPRCLLHWC